MKFEVSTASEFRHFVDVEHFNIDKKYHLEQFEKEIKAIEGSIENLNLAVELSEVKYVRFANGTTDFRTVIRPTIVVYTLEQLLELTQKCDVIVSTDVYDVPSIKFYDSYIE